MQLSIEPSEPQKAWRELKYGMFIHFGPNTLTNSEWGDGRFPLEKIVFPSLSIEQWAETAAKAGMKYAVLTAKHHDGFCLWPSKYTEYCMRNTPQKIDLVGEFVEKFNAVGIKTGLYYSLWDCNFEDYENDAVYANYMKSQLSELATGYGSIVEWWFDGAWDKDHPTREWIFDPEWINNPDSSLGYGERYHWAELYQLIHQLQPDSLVLNNSSCDRPGEIKYFPVDARTAERFNFIYKEHLVEPRLDPIFEKPSGEKVFLPMEYQESITPNWFWRDQKFYYHYPSADTVASWYQKAQSTGANLLLNVGPNAEGLIPTYDQEILFKANNIIKNSF